MKKNLQDFAHFGGSKEFKHPLHIDQVNLPEWSKIRSAFHGIFERRYFANHGPLVRELDKRFASFVKARHAVCVTNGTVALMILAKALNISGEVIVPAYTLPGTVQALSWAGLTPVLCDIDAHTHMVSPETIEPHISPLTSGILAVQLWGQPSLPEILESFSSERGIELIFDARHCIGCSSTSRYIGNFGAGEAFSFHSSQILNGADGGCITTNDSQLADKMRTIRNFHPSETFAPVSLRINGKMSEAQAALALLSLDDFPKNMEANRKRFEAYRFGLSNIPGVTLLEYGQDTTDNYQYVVLEINEEKAGLHRDVFLKLLSAENVICRRPFYPGIHNMTPYSKMTSTINSHFPVTDRLCQCTIQLPTSQIMTEQDVYRVCQIIQNIVQHADAMKSRMVGQT